MNANGVEQILSWKHRRGQERLAVELYYDISNLNHVWKSKGEEAREFSDFIPMRLVTIMEVFVREAIRELVDHGQPYIDRAEKLTKGSRIDFIFASHVHNRKLSIGDIVAHSISVNNPTQFISYFVNMIPDFVQQLKASFPRWIEEKSRWPLPPIISDYDKTIGRIARLFEIRHIITHEVPRGKLYDVSEVDGFIEACSEFVEATDWVISCQTRGELPRTQSEMNIQAGNELEDLTREMNILIEHLQGKGDLNLDCLERSQNAWVSYAEEEATLHASVVEGGSLYPTIWASAKAEVTRHRIAALKGWDRQESDM